jgi:hypothetical protein
MMYNNTSHVLHVSEGFDLNVLSFPLMSVQVANVRSYHSWFKYPPCTVLLHYHSFPRFDPQQFTIYISIDSKYYEDFYTSYTVQIRC